MEKELKGLTNKELIQLYRLILEHQEFLNNEKKKIEEAEANK